MKGLKTRMDQNTPEWASKLVLFHATKIKYIPLFYVEISQSSDAFEGHMSTVRWFVAWLMSTHLNCVRSIEFTDANSTKSLIKWKL